MSSLRLLVASCATLLAACGPLGPEAWEDTGTSDQFLGFDVMPDVELTINSAGVASLEADPRTYVEATIVFEGREYGPVGVRLKGNNSFLPFSQKPSFRVNIDEYIEGATFYGLQDLTFNNMATDPSQMHERLAYWVAREAGLPASRANHMLLTVNGEYYGVYANVETVKPRMLGNYFDDNNGPLFEGTDVDFAPQYVDLYELKSGDDDRTLIAGLAYALTLPGEEAITAAREYLDFDHFQRYWAMETVVGQFDAFPYSIPGDDYYLYADPSSNKLWFIPWGMDETFFAADFSPMQTSSVLAARCKESPACFQSYLDRAWETLALTEDLGLEATRVRIQNELAPWIAQDSRRPFTEAEVAEGQNQLGYFIRGRRTILSGYLPAPQ